MKLDYKKTALRSLVLYLVLLFGSYGIFLFFGFEDFKEIKENEGVLFLGMFLGLFAGYIPHTFVDKKETAE